MLKRYFLGVLLIFILIRCILVIILINGLPQLKWHEGFRFHQGGDQVIYFEIAKGISLAKLGEWKYPLGYPLLLSIFTFIFKAKTWEDILIPVIILQGFVFASLSIILIYLITYKLTRNIGVSLFSAGLWTVFPYILYFSLFIHPKAIILQSAHLPGQLWLQISSEPLSLTLTLLFLFIVLVSIEKRNIIYVILMGVLIGYLVLTRYTNIVFLSMILVLLIRRRFNHALITLCIFLVIFSPQLVYNWVIFGSPFTTGYELDRVELFKKTFGVVYSSYFSLNAPVVFIKQVIGKRPLLVIPAVLLVLIMSIGWWFIYKKTKIKAFVLLLWILSYFIFNLFCVAFRTDPIRYLSPLYPAIIILASYFLLACFKRSNL
jgi:hypothetical protein